MVNGMVWPTAKSNSGVNGEGLFMAVGQTNLPAGCRPGATRPRWRSVGLPQAMDVSALQAEDHTEWVARHTTVLSRTA